MPKYHENFTSIEAILPRGTANNIIKEAYKIGAKYATITTARGTLASSRRLFKPEISPQEDVVKMIVPNERADSVMDYVIKKGNLQLSGAGAIFKMPVLKAYFNEQENMRIPDIPKEMEIANPEEVDYQNELVSIICIVQMGKGDDIAKAALSLGSACPIISFGSGKGQRDRMGIFRIAITAEKELIEVVVGQFDSDRIFETMVDAGKLDLPAMGFIYTRPVPTGIINLPSSIDSKQAASTGQMIKAIDDLKGGTEWRSLGSIATDNKTKKRKYLLNMMTLTLVCDRGKGEDAAHAAMASGAAGATISYGLEIKSAEDEAAKAASGISMTSEKELVEMAIMPDQMNKMVEAMLSANVLEEPGEGYIYTLPVPKALTYLG